MNFFKKIVVMVMILIIYQLNLPGIAISDQSALYPKSETTSHDPDSQIVLERDLPKEEESWFSKYKWWIALGVVAIAGGAAAAGGGGGGGSSGDGGTTTTPASQDDPGGVTVSW